MSAEDPEGAAAGPAVRAALPGSPVSSAHTGVWAAALGLTLLVGVIPQFLLGALGPQLRDALGIGVADVGLAFSLLSGSAVLAAPALGRVIDRVGGRVGAIALLGLSGASLLLASFAESRSGLLLACVPAGLAMAAANPATNRWAAAAEHPSLQSLLIGIGQASVQVGALVAGLLAAALTLGLDWRGALRLAAVLAVLGIAFALRSPPDGPGLVRAGVAQHSDPRRTGQGTDRTVGIRRERRIIQAALGAYALLMGGGSAVVLTYLPTYAVDGVGIGIAVAGSTAVVYGSVAILTRLALSRSLRDPDRVLARVLIGLALGATGAVTLIASASGRGPALLWAGTLLFGATGAAWPMVAFLGVVRASAPGEAGVVTGWVTAAFYVGLFAGPLIGGSLILAAGYSSAWLFSALSVSLAVLPAMRTGGLATLDAGDPDRTGSLR